MSARSPTHHHDRSAATTAERLWPLLTVFVAYFVAGKLGQATTTIRSSNLGPVWPAYGVALAAFLAYGLQVFPAIAASAFLVALSAVSPAAAAGQALGATLAAAVGMLALRRMPSFDPSLTRLRDAIALITIGAFGSAIISSVMGMFSLYVTGIQPYSGIFPAWLIYWLGDSTGVLIITPLIFTLPSLLRLESRQRIEGLLLLLLLTAACFVIFGDLALIPVRLHVLAFAVLPFVIWGAIGFGVAGASLAVFLIAALATVLTAMGSGPFATNTTFVNATLLDVLFAVLAVSGLTLAAAVAERESARTDRAQQRAVEEVLSSVNRKLIDAQEQERSRIGRELHDDIGQRLALLSANLGGLIHGATGSWPNAADLQQMAADLARDVQALSHELHASKVTMLGASGSIRMFCREFGDQHRLRVDFTAERLPDDLPSDTSLSLYRVVQEALHNAAKHSRADRLAVRLWSDDGAVHLEIRDNGIGFDVAQAKRGSGLGLISMEERMKLVGGDLSVSSARQQGTTVHAVAPLQR